MSHHPIPDEALDGRLAIVGISGSGKSTTAKGGVERVLKQDRRVCIVDLLDGWWGLRVKRDGKTQAYPAAIFGGLHGDLPLTESAGALIGQAVAQSDGSSIVSLSELGDDAARRRFALAFFNSLHKHNRAPLHLIIDEADFYAPQQPVKDGPGPMLLNRVKEIAARGRMRGFRCWSITQRPAKLNKDVLSQADTLIAMQLTSTQDRKALDGWIGDQGDEKAGKAVVASLPSLQLGQGVLWSPRLGILETTKFPLPETYDSSRTPEYGEKLPNVELKPLDLGALKERLATVEAETKANDPRALKAEIARLTALTKAIPNITQNITDPALIAAAEQRGYSKGFTEAGRQASISFEALKQLTSTTVRTFAESFQANIRGEKIDFDTQSGSPAASKPAVTAPTRAPVLSAVACKPSPAANGGGNFNPADGLTTPQRRVMTSLAFWKSIGHEAPTREQVAAVAGYRPGSGNFNNIIGGLSTMGQTAVPAPGRLSLNVDYEGLSADEARDKLWSVLDNPQKRLVEAAKNSNGDLARDELATNAGYAPGSGNFNNITGRLTSMDILQRAGTGRIALSDWARQVLS